MGIPATYIKKSISNSIEKHPKLFSNLIIVVIVFSQLATTSINTRRVYLAKGLMGLVKCPLEPMPPQLINLWKKDGKAINSHVVDDDDYEEWVEKDNFDFNEIDWSSEGRRRKKKRRVVSGSDFVRGSKNYGEYIEENRDTFEEEENNKNNYKKSEVDSENNDVFNEEDGKMKTKSISFKGKMIHKKYNYNLQNTSFNYKNVGLVSYKMNNKHYGRTKQKLNLNIMNNNTKTYEDINNKKKSYLTRNKEKNFQTSRKINENAFSLNGTTQKKKYDKNNLKVKQKLYFSNLFHKNEIFKNESKIVLGRRKLATIANDINDKFFTFIRNQPDEENYQNRKMSYLQKKTKKLIYQKISTKKLNTQTKIKLKNKKFFQKTTPHITETPNRTKIRKRQTYKEQDQHQEHKAYSFDIQGNLQIHKVTQQDEGTYTCYLYASSGNRAQWFDILVLVRGEWGLVWDGFLVNEGLVCGWVGFI